MKLLTKHPLYSEIPLNIPVLSPVWWGRRTFGRFAGNSSQAGGIPPLRPHSWRPPEICQTSDRLKRVTKVTLCSTNNNNKILSLWFDRRQARLPRTLSQPNMLLLSFPPGSIGWEKNIHEWKNFGWWKTNLLCTWQSTLRKKAAEQTSSQIRKSSILSVVLVPIHCSDDYPAAFYNSQVHYLIISLIGYLWREIATDAYYEIPTFDSSPDGFNARQLLSHWMHHVLSGIG